MNDQQKSIEQLKDKVHSGLDLLSDQELALLFAESESEPQNAPTPQATQPEPSGAPASVETTPPVVEAPKGQAELLNLMPEKFRDKDEAASLTKMLKAMQDQEAELTRKSQEVSQLQNVVQELSRKPREEYRQPTPQPTPPPVRAPEPEVEMDDLGFLDNPVANAKVIAERVARQVAEEVSKRVSVEQIRDYDTFSLRRTTFEKFRSEHSDFDNIKAEFAEACRIHPEWDSDISGLPKLYDFAKTLAKAKGVSMPTNVSTTTSVTDMEKLRAEIRAEVEASSYEKAKQAITEEIKRRKAAAGIMSSTSTTAQEKSEVVPRTTAKTQEEEDFDAMMKSGPRSLDILKGV